MGICTISVHLFCAKLCTLWRLAAEINSNFVGTPPYFCCVFSLVSDVFINNDGYLNEIICLSNNKIKENYIGFDQVHVQRFEVYDKLQFRYE